MLKVLDVSQMRRKVTYLIGESDESNIVIRRSLSEGTRAAAA
jgi:hypothetical protein